MNRDVKYFQKAAQSRSASPATVSAIYEDASNSQEPDPTPQGKLDYLMYMM